MNTLFNLNDIVNDLHFATLTNTDDDTFWWTNMSKTGVRFKQETAKVGDIFYDGNNGDKWEVLAANTENKRLIVTNLIQGHYAMLVIWD